MKEKAQVKGFIKLHMAFLHKPKNTGSFASHGIILPCFAHL